jgi:glycosyltransferase A (GT-A) superfamily protein (DUF2064 family)
MTVLAVLAAPPRPGLVLSDLPASTPLSEEDAANLYAAALRDVVSAVDASGGDPLVNYLPDDALPERFVQDESAEAAIRRALTDADAVDVDGVRFERQVGSTHGARVGNTVTHLLREEEATSAAVLRPTAPLLTRTIVDSAAMKLRRSSVVLGPTTGGRTYYAGFADTIDFEGVDTVPELTTTTDRARDAGHDVDFVPTVPTVETPADLVSTVAVVTARRRADRPVPAHTAEVIESLGLAIDGDEGVPTLVRTDTS